MLLVRFGLLLSLVSALDSLVSVAYIFILYMCVYI